MLGWAVANFCYEIKQHAFVVTFKKSINVRVKLSNIKIFFSSCKILQNHLFQYRLWHFHVQSCDVLVTLSMTAHFARRSEKTKLQNMTWLNQHIKMNAKSLIRNSGREISSRNRDEMLMKNVLAAKKSQEIFIFDVAI